MILRSQECVLFHRFGSSLLLGSRGRSLKGRSDVDETVEPWADVLLLECNHPCIMGECCPHQMIDTRALNLVCILRHDPSSPHRGGTTVVLSDAPQPHGS